jgi:hypothetical protein
MSIQVKFRRGTSTQHNSFTGANGEITVDTTNKTLRVHDGVTVGGIRLAKYNELSSVTANVSAYLQVANANAKFATKAYAASNAYVKLQLANTNSYIASRISRISNGSETYVLNVQANGTVKFPDGTIMFQSGDGFQIEPTNIKGISIGSGTGGINYQFSNGAIGTNQNNPFKIKTTYSVGLTTYSNYWEFTRTGVLKLPVNGTITFANDISIFANYSTSTQIADTYATKAYAASNSYVKILLGNTNNYIASKVNTSTFNLALANTNTYKLNTSTFSAALANTNNYIATKLNTSVFNSALANTNSYIGTVSARERSSLANTNAYIATKLSATAFNSALANTNNYIATKLNTSTFNSALANTNNYIATKASWTALTATNTAIRVLDAQKLQVSNATTLFAGKASWSALTSTNTTLRTLISDRLQVANASAMFASITGASFSNNIAVANTIITKRISIVANGSIDFDGSVSKPSFQKGRMYWDDEEKTIIVYGDGSSFEQSMGQREWVRCRNSTSNTIFKGQPVYVTGVHIPGNPIHGHHPTIGLALASDVNRKDVIGLAGEDIVASAHGYVVVRGYIEGLNTSALTPGQRAHLGFAAPGTIVVSAPEYPNYPTDLGICLTSNSTVGTFYVDIAQHSLERLRVTYGAYVGGDLTIGGALRVTGNVISTAVNNLSVTDNFIYIGAGDTIATTNFTGAGLNDGVFHGVYEGTTTTTYYVKIDSTGATDTFAWSKNDFSTTIASGIAITGGFQALDNNVTIKFNAITGHTLNNKWYGTAAPVNVDLGWIGNYNDGVYHHTGLFRDASDGVYKFFQNYTPEPDAAVNIDTDHASFRLAPVSVQNLTVANNVTISGNTKIRGLFANGSLGISNYVLRTNGTNIYWAPGGGGSTAQYLQVANAVATYQTKAVERAALANTNSYIGTVSARERSALANTNAFIKSQLANTNSFIKSQLANTNSYIGAVSARERSALANTNAYIASVISSGGAVPWIALTSTNTALRVLISDRLQVANAIATYQTKAVERAALANTNSYIATKLNTSTFNLALANTNSYIGTVSARERSALANTNLYIGTVSSRERSALANTNNYIASKVSTATFNLALANTNSYISTKVNTSTFNLALANTNSYIATKLNTSTFNLALANTNNYIATKASWTSVTGTNTALRTLISDRIQVANAYAIGATRATWAALTTTNTALRTLISDRLQVANATTQFNTKASWTALTGTNTALRTLISDRYQVANVNTLLATKATWTALTGTNTAIRTLVADRLQVANAVATYLTKNNPVITGTLTANA